MPNDELIEAAMKDDCAWPACGCCWDSMCAKEVNRRNHLVAVARAKGIKRGIALERLDEAQAARLPQRLVVMTEKYNETLDKVITLTAQLAAAEARAANLQKALEVYADSCDVPEASQDCGYETHLCCMTARAALRTLTQEPSNGA